MMLYNCACLHSRMDETERALELLRLAVSKGQLNFGWLKHDPDLAALHDNPEFIAITTGLARYSSRATIITSDASKSPNSHERGQGTTTPDPRVAADVTCGVRAPELTACYS